jgi:hypothetical protein
MSSEVKLDAISKKVEYAVDVLKLPILNVIENFLVGLNIVIRLKTESLVHAFILLCYFPEI